MKFLDSFEPPKPRKKVLPPLSDFEEARHREEVLFGRNFHRLDELRGLWRRQKVRKLRAQYRKVRAKARHKRHKR